MKTKFQYQGESLLIHISTYTNGGALAVSLFAEDGPYATLSTNLDPESMARLPEGAFYLKDWSENMALAEYMLDHGILQYTKPRITAIAGHTWADAVRFTKSYQR